MAHPPAFAPPRAKPSSSDRSRARPRPWPGGACLRARSCADKAKHVALSSHVRCLAPDMATRAAREILRGVVSPLYLVAGVLSYPVVKWGFRLRAYGTENIPRDGGFVLSANHLSNFDPWPLGMPLWPGRQLRFMAKVELFR